MRQGRTLIFRSAEDALTLLKHDDNYQSHFGSRQLALERPLRSLLPAANHRLGASAQTGYEHHQGFGRCVGKFSRRFRTRIPQTEKSNQILKNRNRRRSERLKSAFFVNLSPVNQRPQAESLDLPFHDIEIPIAVTMNFVAS